jgi:hypothetical protein
LSQPTLLRRLDEKRNSSFSLKTFAPDEFLEIKSKKPKKGNVEVKTSILKS